MTKQRMEAFSDGVLAIIITVMVLKIQIPKESTISAFKELLPIFIVYILSYIYIGIYWLNHHYLVSAVQQVTSRHLWMNLHWLFWMSLIPMSTEWGGNYPHDLAPAIFYGVILLMSAISYFILETTILKENPKVPVNHHLKTVWSMVLYMSGIGCAFWYPLVSYVIYMGILFMWFIPEKHKALRGKERIKVK